MVWQHHRPTLTSIEAMASGSLHHLWTPTGDRPRLTGRATSGSRTARPSLACGIPMELDLSDIFQVGQPCCPVCRSYVRVATYKDDGGERVPDTGICSCCGEIVVLQPDLTYASATSADFDRWHCFNPEFVRVLRECQAYSQATSALRQLADQHQKRRRDDRG